MMAHDAIQVSGKPQFSKFMSCLESRNSTHFSRNLLEQCQTCHCPLCSLYRLLHVNHSFTPSPPSPPVLRIVWRVIRKIFPYNIVVCTVIAMQWPWNERINKGVMHLFLDSGSVNTFPWLRIHTEQWSYSWKQYLLLGVCKKGYKEDSWCDLVCCQLSSAREAQKRWCYSAVELRPGCKILPTRIVFYVAKHEMNFDEIWYLGDLC
jgi:hypothetical protein